MKGCVFLVVLALSWSSCKPSSPESTLAAAGESYQGQIRVSMANLVPGTASDYKLVFSAGPEVFELGVCTSSVLTECTKNSRAYGKTLKIYQTGQRAFFAAEENRTITDGLTLLLVASDAQGRSLDSRRVRFYRQASATNPSPGSGGLSSATIANETKGSGGAKGFREEKFGTNGRYQIDVPADNDASKSYGLLVFLHGSSASNYDRWVKESKNVATTHNLIPVPVRAPNGSGWNEGDQNANAKYQTFPRKPPLRITVSLAALG